VVDVKQYFLDRPGPIIWKSALILMIFTISGLLIAQFMPQSLPGALAVFASPIQASCYQPLPDRCRIHVEPYTINIASGSKLVQFQLVATRIGAGTNTIIYDFRPDQSNPIPYSGTTYTPSQVAKDFAAACGQTYTVSLQGRDTSDSSLYNLGTTGQFSCPVAVDTTYPTVIGITRLDVNPNSAVTVRFKVTFSESVIGVDISDYNLTVSGVSGATVSGVSGTGSVYTVTVNTGSGNGTLRLNVADDNSILDGATNSLGGVNAGDGNFITGEVYKIIKTPTFADVPLSYWSWSFIERLYAAGITSGCTVSPLNYCPNNTVTRAEMAIFLLRGIHGPSYSPPVVGGTTNFADVPVDYWAARWIKQLAVEGITGGCGAGIYCPDSAVTRAEMAVFLLKSKHGAAFVPPAATGLFTDVPVGYWARNWIEQLAVEGITGGCGGANYCPDSNVTRAEMAVFLVRTFNLP